MVTTFQIILIKLGSFLILCQNFVIISVLKTPDFQITCKKNKQQELLCGGNFKFLMYLRWSQVSVDQIKEKFKANIFSQNILWKAVKWFFKHS